MAWWDVFDVSASGLAAERLRMDVIAENLANANTTRTAAGGPYRRKVVVFAPQEPEPVFSSILRKELSSKGRGVKVERIAEDQSPFRQVYDPGHPDANAEGMVTLPNVNTVLEMVDLIAATRAYEANLAALNTARTMASQALELGRG